jgi:SAM-dependent methyltransferase
VTDVRTTYDRVADEYVSRIAGELQHKPLDRQLLDRFAERIGAGSACDVGCGPGHVARYLHDRGVSISGIDLSPAMVARARALHPGIEFSQGDMLALDTKDASWTGIVAFYSVIHIPRPDVVRALHELRRTLQPGGLLFLAFHIGDEVLHRDEWWGHEVDIDFILFTSAEMIGYLEAAGFDVEETIERDPYPDVEHPSRRAYIVARKP